MKIKKKNKGIIPGVHLWGSIFFFFWEKQHTCLLSPNKKPTAGLGTDTRKGQLDEPMSFIEVT